MVLGDTQRLCFHPDTVFVGMRLLRFACASGRLGLGWIEREFEKYDREIVEALADASMSVEERNGLLLQREELWDRYHLVTKRDDTDRKVGKLGALLFFVMRAVCRGKVLFKD